MMAMCYHTEKCLQHGQTENFGDCSEKANGTSLCNFKVETAKVKTYWEAEMKTASS